jgi:hypothetical protein
MPPEGMASRAFTDRLTMPRVALRPPQVRLERQLERDVIPQQAPQEFLAGAHRGVQVERFQREDLLSRVGQQLPGEVAGPIRREGDLVHHLRIRRPSNAGVLLQRLGAAHDHGEQVVEVVGHPASELADCLHLGSLMKGAAEPVAICLGPLQAGDVAGHGKDHLLTAQRDHPCREKAGPDLSAPLAKLRLQVQGAIVPTERLDQSPLIRWVVPDLGLQGSAPHDLGGCPAGEMREALVRRKIRSVAEPVQAQRVGTGLERDAKALLALPKGFLGALAVGDVPEDGARVRLAARAGDQGGRDLDRKDRAVAPPEAKFTCRRTLHLPFGEQRAERRVVDHDTLAPQPQDLRLRHAKSSTGGGVGA